MKRFHYIPLCLILLLFCLMTSFGDSKRKVFEEVVIKWTGKEILFPDSMRLVGGGMIAKPEADFTIVSYYDSVGCTGCRMKSWRFRREVITGWKSHSMILYRENSLGR